MSSVYKDKLVDDILTLADKLFRQLFPSVPKEILTLDVTMPQMKIMLTLYFQGAVRMSTLASEMDVALPTATSLVDRLVEKKYVLREAMAEDRRVVLCRLSEKGQKAIGSIWESSRIRSQELLEKMNVTHLRMFADVLEEMLRSANAGNELAEGKNETGEKY